MDKVKWMNMASKGLFVKDVTRTGELIFNGEAWKDNGPLITAEDYFYHSSSALATGMGIDMLKMSREREQINLPIGEKCLMRFHIGGNLWTTKDQYNEFMKEIKRECEEWINI